jgi:hypothetical protein
MHKLEQVSFWQSRQRRGDISAVAYQTNYSVSHVSNMIKGTRTLDNYVALALYRISRRRTANWVLAFRRGVDERKIATTKNW